MAPRKPARHRGSRRAGEERRENRVVTFVTNAELQQLEALAAQQDRSLSWTVHRLIVQGLEEGGGPDEPGR